ncbi:hypothetical protein BST31_18330 [Mycobacterium marseillense]|nr:hypothetical protein BST31_18330 [Mycobacterium marseillense]
MAVSSCTAIGPAQGWPGRGLRYFISFSVRRACSQGEDSAEFSPQVHARRARGPKPARAQWNWPSSVEPVSAVVDEVGSTVVAMRSK